MVVQIGVIPFRRKGDGTLTIGETFDMPYMHAARRFAEALMLVPDIVGAVVTGSARRETAGEARRPRLIAEYGEVDRQALVR